MAIEELCEGAKCQSTTRLYDHRTRCNIENIDVRLHHRVDASRGEQVIMQKIAIAADAIQFRNHLTKGRPLRTRGKGLQIASRQGSGLESRDLTHT